MSVDVFQNTRLRDGAALTSTAGFGLVPGSVLGAVQYAAAGRLHQVTGVTVVRHRVVVGELAGHVDPIGYRPGISAADD